MPDLLPAAETLAEKRCLVTLRNQPDFVLLQPIDARDTLTQEMPLLAAQTTRSFLHVAFPVEAWNVDLSPWDAPPVFGREAFGHGAADTLAWLRSRLMPEVRAKYAISPDAPVILGGYSLAGLFCLWSAAQTDAFAAVAAVSPSVWFPGWRAYADQHALRSRVVYLSLGDREEKSRNPVLASVGDAIRREDARLSERGVRHTLQWNVGNHFQDAEKRCADGFAWCMAQRKAEGKKHMNMKQYETFELRFGGEVLPDAWAQIDLTATFSCAQESLTVKGFYDGESDGRGVYVVRFLPQYAGVYRYQVRGAVTAEGEIVCEASSPEAHGIVRAVGTHFAFADGAPYIPFGTTVYALISQDDALVEQTLQSLAAAPFNKLRLCVFPKDYDYNHNEPPLYAFARREDGSWDTSRPSIAFYQRLERILRRIAALGIQLDLILFHPYDRWGFATMPQADNFRYLDYLLRRLSAMPEIWWSLANEYDLCMPKKTLADWEALEAFVASCDPYHHLLSCHNCFCFWDFKRKDVTHASIQTRALTEIPRYLREYGKPVVIDECCYEGDLPHIWGSISGQEMVRRFWRCYVGGGACTHGETFLSPDDVLWWARGGVLKGESPKRIAFLRRVIEELPGFLSPLESVWEEAEQQDEAQRPDWIRPFLASLSRMAPPDRHMLLCGEHLWAAHCAEDAYLWYYGQQTAREQIIKLPPAHRYRVEALDTWNMTRETLQTGVSGRVVLTLPGREDMAVLAVRMD